MEAESSGGMMAIPHNKICTLEHIMARVTVVNGCWLWKPYKDKWGYGTTGKGERAHRRAYEILRGPIPEGLQLDHLCRVRACVNPDHLEPVTPRENVRRSGPAQRTHCPQGHAYTPDNTSIWGGKRSCKTCARIAYRIKTGWSREEAISTPVISPKVLTSRRTFSYRTRKTHS